MIVLAKGNGVELTEQEAQDYYLQLHQKSAELADNELDNVAGGVNVGSSDAKGHIK